MNQLSAPVAMPETKTNYQTVQMSDTGSGGGLLMPRSFGEVVAFAELMARAQLAIPKHLRENAGACMAVAMQALRWEMDPFSVANKSYFVNDRLAYEAQLVHSVIASRAPIRGRLKVEYDGAGPSRRCRVWARLRDEDEVVEYWSPPFAAINPKNSPLWKNDPDQQLFYFSARSFARRHFPDVIMGVLTRDEVDDSSPMRDVTPQNGGARLAEKLAAGAAAAAQIEGPTGFDADHVTREIDGGSAEIAEADEVDEQPSLLDAAREEATDGTASFDKWMESLSLEDRQALAPHIAGLMKVARAADDLAKSDAAAEDDDFPGDKKSSKQK
ncbi:MAG: recombinase RecT [Beijerinckiaceae bacterium]|nr:recombinase RecT [Beijerinckiaceae bacterium]